jgi:ORF6N domain.
MNDLLKLNDVESKIVILRNQRVILDSDVALLYGVETKRVNEAVKNNWEKFPTGYVFLLDEEEWKNLKSKFSTSSWGGIRKHPSAFTEKGLYMLATILRSPKATETTLTIIETFTKIRELSRTIEELIVTSNESKQKSLMQKGGEMISDIMGEGMKTTDRETSIEINFAVLKVKHTIKQKK